MLFPFALSCVHQLYWSTNVHLQDLFAAGTDTSTSTLKWAMAEMLRQPEIMRKAQVELAEFIGKGKPIEETDVSRLP